jgi:hypothetical protein
MTADRLSKVQRDLLLWAYDHRPTSAVNVMFGARLKWPTGLPPARRASLSRALRRLERRGLILRQNTTTGNPETGAARKSPDEPHTRTNGVALTVAGLELCERLTQETMEQVNRSEIEKGTSDKQTACQGHREQST